jgi:uncharacterized membrane protein YsdA (DUF1294 family)
MDYRLLIYFLVALNAATFVVYGIDKWRATHQQWRIPEATLLLLAVLGGSLGAWLGMKVWHHKTLKPRFRYGIPAIIALQAALLCLCSCKSHRAARSQALTTMPFPRDGRLRDPIGEFSPTTLIIMYDSDVGKQPLLEAVRKYKAEVIYDYSIIPGMAIRKPEDKTLEEAIVMFRKVKGVTSVEKDRITRLTDPVKPRLETR